MSVNDAIRINIFCKDIVAIRDWYNLAGLAAGLFKYLWSFCFHQALKG